MRWRLMAALGVTMALAMLVAWGELGGARVLAATAPSVIRESGEPGNPKLARKKEYLRSRFVDVDFKLLTDRTKERLTLDLFPDVSLVAVRESLERDKDGSWEWTGSIEGVEDSEVILDIDEDAVAGSIRVGGRSFAIEDTTGPHLVVELDPRFVLKDGKNDDPPATERQHKAPAATHEDDGSVIDVMVVYTPEAKEEAGGRRGVETRIDHAIAVSNRSFRNSRIPTSFRLVHTQEVDYTEDDYDTQQTLHRLRDPEDGYMDEVHEWRDQHAADVVVLIVASEEPCPGMAALMGPSRRNKEMERYAFAVVAIDYASEYLTFPHEIGHIMGCCHDKDNAGDGGGAYPYSFGWPTDDFRDIMSYSQPSRCRRVCYWSNPRVTYQGVPTGVEDEADNARSITNVLKIVANFRDSATATAQSSHGWDGVARRLAR